MKTIKTIWTQREWSYICKHPKWMLSKHYSFTRTNWKRSDSVSPARCSLQPWHVYIWRLIGNNTQYLSKHMVNTQSLPVATRSSRKAGWAFLDAVWTRHWMHKQALNGHKRERRVLSLSKGTGEKPLLKQRQFPLSQSAHGSGGFWWGRIRSELWRDAGVSGILGWEPFEKHPCSWCPDTEPRYKFLLLWATLCVSHTPRDGSLSSSLADLALGILILV